MNKKGFTLVEILAVIVILSLIIVIVATKGFGAFNNTKKKIFEEAFNEAKEAAEVLMTDVEFCDEDLDLLDGTLYGANTCSKLQEEADKNKGCLEISLDYLINKKYVTGTNATKLLETNPDMTFQGCLEFDENENIIDNEVFCKTDCELKNNVTEGDPSVFEDEDVITCSKYYSLDDNTLTCSVIANDKIVKNETTPTFTGIATEEEGMYKAEDDYGTSWYFRGAQSNNYVNFAGFIWRIVRINGDGSVRLILDSTIDKVKKDNININTNENLKSIDNDGLLAFHDQFEHVTTEATDDNTYVGYMYNYWSAEIRRMDGITTYDLSHQNIQDSTIKKYIDIFYEEYIIDYQNYLEDVIFCGDKSLASDGFGGISIQLGHGRNETYYSASERLVYNSDRTPISEAKPTLECAKGATNTYSRYTSIIDTSTSTNKGVSVNNDLKYPIALLSGDELVMAGAFISKPNNTFYLYSGNRWCTMTPILFDSWASEIYIDNSTSLYPYYTYDYTAGVRPVINLNDDVLVNSGDGTKTNPYTVKLN